MIPRMLRHFGRSVRAGTTARSVALVAGGSIGAQAIAVLALPVISRLYSPSDFGVYSYLVGIAMVAVTFVSLKFEAGVPLSANDSVTQALVRLAIVTSTTICAVVLIVSSLLPASFDSAIGASAAQYFTWVPVLVWVTSLFVIFNQVALRQRDYGTLVRRGLVASAVTVGIQLLWPWSRSTSGLMAGPIAGRTAASALLAIRFRPTILARVPAKDMVNAVRAYWRLPAAFAPSALLNALGSQLPILVIARTFGAGDAGEFGMALQVSAIPGALIGAALSQVFLGEFAARHRAGTGAGKRDFVRATRRLLLPAGLSFVGLFVVAPMLLPWILGDEWIQVGDFTRAMALAISVGVVVSPLSQVFLIYQRAVWNVGLDISRITLMVGVAVLSASMALSAVQTVALLYGVLLAVYIATWIGALHVVSAGSPSAAWAAPSEVEEPT